MLSDDELDRMLRAADPAADLGADRTATDPDSPAAARILARIRQRTRRRRRRTMVVVPVVALTAAGATAGAYAWVAGDGQGHTLDSSGLTCVGSEHHDAIARFDPATDDPVRSCRGLWRQTFGEPAPDRLTACVDSSRQGSIQVYPGGRDQCARHRADPYRGPTREQLDLAHFRTDIQSRLADRTCVPYPEFRDVIAKLLAEHDLSAWKTDHHQTASKEPEGPCAEILSYDEPARTVWLSDHRAGERMVFP